MTNKQFVAACHVPPHPGNKFLNKSPNPRNMKNTIISLYESNVKEEYQCDPPTNSDYKKVLKTIHSKSVKTTIDSYPPNKVLNSKPPDINNSEQELDRNVRVELSRLRSGYSRLLNSYMSRIDPSIQDVCPRCDLSPHNTQHLFNCPRNPTTLTKTDLWTRPKLAAEFLQLDDPG